MTSEKDFLRPMTWAKLVRPLSKRWTETTVCVFENINEELEKELVNSLNLWWALEVVGHRDSSHRDSCARWIIIGKYKTGEKEGDREQWKGRKHLEKEKGKHIYNHVLVSQWFFSDIYLFNNLIFYLRQMTYLCSSNSSVFFIIHLITWKKFHKLAIGEIIIKNYIPAFHLFLWITENNMQVCKENMAAQGKKRKS